MDSHSLIQRGGQNKSEARRGGVEQESADIVVKRAGKARETEKHEFPQYGLALSSSALLSGALAAFMRIPL